MNKDTFLKFIANSRDCDQLSLDTAIYRGLNKAKNDKLDSKKFFMLAAACVFTFVMCISVNLTPIQAGMENYYQRRDNAMRGSAEILDGYINNIVNNYKRFIGEE